MEEAQPHDSEVSGSGEVDGATDGRVCALESEGCWSQELLQHSWTT